MLPEVLEPASRTGARVFDWPGDPAADAVALRICGGLHRLVRAGHDPALAAVYPPREPRDPELRDTLARALIDHDAMLAEWLDSPPQTNEVGRSGVLLGGLQIIASVTGHSLRLFEIGACAGLNLMPDCWSYELGNNHRWGAANAPLTIECDWRGTLPPLRRLCIAGRRGCDQAPVDPRGREERERLLAWIWPDQTGRLARTEAALDHASRHAAPVDRADAAEWLEAELGDGEDDETRVLMHSIMWQYLDDETKRRLTMTMVVQGVEATAKRPLAWLRMEADGAHDTAAIILTTWPGGRTRELGRADFHGRFVEWSGER